MNFDEIPYPCIGYCMTDSRGYCVGCGRPPTLGMPDSCVRQAAAPTSPAESSPPPGAPATK